MFFGFFWGDWTILILLPAMIFAFWAQIKVNSTFNKYSKIPSQSGLTGAQAARRLLDANGLYNVPIVRIQGNLTDHYDPRNQTLCLSAAVHDSVNPAAIGVACHEAGHAIQHANGYVPLTVRMRMVPLCNIGANLAMPLFIIGLLLPVAAEMAGPDLGSILMLSGIACFSLSTFFQLVTLPVEFNASRRAIEGIRDHGILPDSELPAARKVLSAAAMTYVAALATSLLSLIRLILIAQGSRRR